MDCSGAPAWHWDGEFTSMEELISTRLRPLDPEAAEAGSRGGYHRLQPTTPPDELDVLMRSLGPPLRATPDRRPSGSADRTIQAAGRAAVAKRTCVRSRRPRCGT